MLINYGKLEDYIMAVVATIFATINFVCILFRAIGIIIVMVLNDATPNRASSYCQAADKSGDPFAEAFCSGQELLVSGILLLLISQVLVLILSVHALKYENGVFLYANRRYFNDVNNVQNQRITQSSV
jgi:hypothetical protein